MADINSITITGNATKDVELKTTTSGKSVANISVAVHGINDETSYFEVVCWNRTAEIAAQYVKKGKQIAVSGRLNQRKWNDGDSIRQSIEIVADNLKLLGSSENRPLAQHEVISKYKDVVLEDIDDKPIDLSEIRF